jgi:hypothetical protein
MRTWVPATAACLLLSALAAANEPPAASSPAPTSTPPATAGTAAGATADNEAAAKHAKRTACLKAAKAKKLVGPQRTAFIKECIAAP